MYLLRAADLSYNVCSNDNCNSFSITCLSSYSSNSTFFKKTNVDCVEYDNTLNTNSGSVECDLRTSACFIISDINNLTYISGCDTLANIAALPSQLYTDGMCSDNSHPETS